MKIDLYTLCWNEMKIIPFVIDYWKNIKNQIDDFHVYVFDNGSDDGSIEAFSKYDWITVCNFNSDGFKDLINIRIKNNVWKNSIGKSDYVIVCDLDECLFCNDFKSFFDKIKKGKYTICLPIWAEMFSETFPVKNDELLHKQVNKYCEGVSHVKRKISISKAILFDPNEISEINYNVGGHVCKPKGNIKWYKGDDLFILHYKHLSIDYVLWRYKICNERMSLINRLYNWGHQYWDKRENIIKDFNEHLEKCLNIEELIK